MKHNIELLVGQLIESHFPELANTKILIRPVKDASCFCYIVKMPLPGYLLSYTKSVSELSEFELKGVLAHELAHVIQDKRGLFIAILKLIRSRSAVEREADQIVIDRGLGENLHAFLKYHDKHYKKYNTKDGLTKKEVKRLIKE